MNGSDHYGNVKPNLAIPPPAPVMPIPPPGFAGIPVPPPMLPQQRYIESLNYNKPPMAPVNIPQGEQVNSGHYSLFRMNGSDHYGNVKPNLAIPPPAPVMPIPPPGFAGIPVPPPMLPQQRYIESLNYNKPPMAPVNIPQGEQVNNGHYSLFRMNGSDHYGNVKPNLAIPPPAPVMPIPPPGFAGIPVPPPMLPQQRYIESLNYNKPPMAPVNIPQGEQVNNGHYSFSSPPPGITQQDSNDGSNGRRLYERYKSSPPLVQEGPVQFRTFVPHSNVPIYSQETPAPREDMFPPLTSEIYPHYHVNASSYGYGQLSDPVWAPMPGEIFTFGDMLSALPPPPPPPLAVEAPPGFPRADRPVMIPLIRCDRSSPMESVGARAVGGPVATAAFQSRLAVGADWLARERPSLAVRLTAVDAPPGFPRADRPVMIPLISCDRSSPMESVGARAVGGSVATAAFQSRLSVGADWLAREKPPLAVRLAADDQELEEALQALERCKDIEHNNAD